MTRDLPYLFVVGFPKAGTSSVFTWLADHPEVSVSLEKETRFFTDPGSHVFNRDFNVEHGLSGFACAFPEPSENKRLRVEATPTHVYSQRALAHIPGTGARCLFIARDPAAQIRSLYDYFRNSWTYIPADLSFPEYIAVVRGGNPTFGGNELAERPFEHAEYERWLAPWRAALGPERMKVCTFDRVMREPVVMMEELASWCGLSPGFYTDYPFPSENESYEPRSRALQRLNLAVRQRLPGGRIYDRARWLYRRLNTRKPDRTGGDETMADLRQHFAPMNRTLAEAYELDLSAWMP